MLLPWLLPLLVLVLKAATRPLLLLLRVLLLRVLLLLPAVVVAPAWGCLIRHEGLLMGGRLHKMSRTVATHTDAQTHRGNYFLV
jgi:hypothetical protein